MGGLAGGQVDIRSAVDLVSDFCIGRSTGGTDNGLDGYVIIN